MIRNVFWNESERRLRAFWRLLLQLLLMALLALAPVVALGETLTALRHHGLFLSEVSDEIFDKLVNLVVGPAFTLLVLASIALAARILDRRRFADFGAHLDRGWWIDLTFGFLLGAALQALIFGVELGAGWIRVTGSFRTSSSELPIALALVYSTVKALCVGTYEEFLSRGYQLKNLSEGLTSGQLGERGAVLVALFLSSAVFSLLHGWNDNASAGSALGLLVNGLLLGAGWAATGELAIPIGVHAGWNLAQGSVFGFPVSGDLESGSLLSIDCIGPVPWTGGAFGPEAGAVGVGAMLVGIALILGFARLRKRSR